MRKGTGERGRPKKGEGVEGEEDRGSEKSVPAPATRVERSASQRAAWRSQRRSSLQARGEGGGGGSSNAVVKCS